VTDRNSALAAMDRCEPNLLAVESVLVDGGYTGHPFADSVKDRLSATVQVAKRNDLHSFVVLPKRWVVERDPSDGWRNADACGRTARENLTPACSSSTSHFSCSY
jgi:transposase